MIVRELEGKVAIVVGASQGLGKGVAQAFSDAGAHVIGIARNPAAGIVAADAADPVVAGNILAEHRPDVLALVGGAAPLLRPIHLQTWETFSANWHSDVRITFHWLREALLLPLRRGSRIIVMSSGAAIMGSPLSGGYAGAKATQRFLAAYAAQESQRLQLGIGISAVLPRLTPTTRLGRPAVAAYAAREGVSVEVFLTRMGEPVTPEIAGAAFLRLATRPDGESGAYLLSADGLRAVDLKEAVV